MSDIIIDKVKTIEISRRSFLKRSAVVAGGAILTQEELFAKTSEKKNFQNILITSFIFT